MLPLMTEGVLFSTLFELDECIGFVLILKYHVCDGYNDCLTGEDENNCLQKQFIISLEDKSENQLNVRNVKQKVSVELLITSIDRT